MMGMHVSIIWTAARSRAGIDRNSTRRRRATSAHYCYHASLSILADRNSTRGRRATSPAYCYHAALSTPKRLLCCIRPTDLSFSTRTPAPSSLCGPSRQPLSPPWPVSRSFSTTRPTTSPPTRISTPCLLLLQYPCRSQQIGRCLVLREQLPPYRASPSFTRPVRRSGFGISQANNSTYVQRVV